MTDWTQDLRTSLSFRRLITIGGLLMLPIVSARVGAQSATQVVNFRVIAINRATVSGMSAPLTMRSTGAVADGGRFAVASNEANAKIVASLDQALPRGATLSVSLAAPRGAASAGLTPVTTAGTDVITDLPAGTTPALPIAYSVSGDRMQGGVGTQRRVTYTVIAGS